MTKETTWKEFAGHIATNLIAGGIAGAILAKLDLKVAGVDEEARRT